MSPRLRRAMHEALDHVLDALEADEAESSGANPRAKQSKVRPIAPGRDVAPEVRAKALAALTRAGLA